jgi:hypothetical protein
MSAIFTRFHFSMTFLQCVDCAPGWLLGLVEQDDFAFIYLCLAAAEDYLVACKASHGRGI